MLELTQEQREYPTLITTLQFLVQKTYKFTRTAQPVKTALERHNQRWNLREMSSRTIKSNSESL